MENVHFLNLEYLLLRVYQIFYHSPVTSGVYGTATAPGSAVLHTLAVKNPRWERVRELANTTSESDWRLAILEADIMLNDLLKEQGYRGEGIGERLRDANPLQFATLDLAWQAHKVRNDIAHAGEGLSSLAARSKRNDRFLSSRV
jgi:hypothetical protein